MAKLPFEVPTQLPLEEAKRRVDALLQYWARKYGITSTWAGERATMRGRAVGVSIDGALEVLATRISGEASDPGFLLRGQARKYLEQKFAEYLDPRRPLEDIVKGED